MLNGILRSAEAEAEAEGLPPPILSIFSSARGRAPDPGSLGVLIRAVGPGELAACPFASLPLPLPEDLPLPGIPFCMVNKALSAAF
jgi:hypothetical protein